MFLPWPHRGLGADFSAIDQDSQMSTQATNQSEENTNAIQKMIIEIRYIWLGKQRTTCTRKPGPSGSSRPARESNQQKLHTAPPRPNPTPPPNVKPFRWEWFHFQLWFKWSLPHWSSFRLMQKEQRRPSGHPRTSQPWTHNFTKTH